MTVSSEVSKSGPYTGNGVTTSFAYNFKIYDASHIRVVRTEGGIDTDVISGFSVTGVGLNAGSVVFDLPPTASQRITLVRDIPQTQELDLVNQGSFFAEDVEKAFDLAAMRDQQLQEQVDRSVKIPVGKDISDFDDLIADITSLAEIREDVSTVADVAEDVTAVAGIEEQVQVVALNVADVQNFADKYQIAAAEPTTRADGSPLQEGDLYYDTSEKRLKTWTGLVWQQGASSVNGILYRSQHVATAGQTIFSAIYDVGFAEVFMNGVKLKGGGVDFTATNGTSITLTSPAALNDEIEILSFGAFSLANMLEKSQNLADIPDKPAARTALELPKQTSVNDATPGRMMTVGAFGIGGAVIGAYSSDANGIPHGGMFLLSAAAANSPDPTFSWYIIHTQGSSPDNASQLAICRDVPNSGLIATRSRSGGGWGSWQTIDGRKGTVPSASMAGQTSVDVSFPEANKFRMVLKDVLLPASGGFYLRGRQSGVGVITSAVYDYTTIQTVNSDTGIEGANGATFIGLLGAVSTLHNGVIEGFRQGNTNDWYVSGDIRRGVNSALVRVHGKIAMPGKLNGLRLQMTSGNFAGGSFTVDWEY